MKPQALPRFLFLPSSLDLWVQVCLCVCVCVFSYMRRGHSWRAHFFPQNVFALVFLVIPMVSLGDEMSWCKCEGGCSAPDSEWEKFYLCRL